MTNQLYAGGPFDGTAIGASFNGLPTAPLLQPNGARFEAVKMNWIGSSNRETQVMYVWDTAPIRTLDDLKTNADDCRRAGAGLDAIRLSEDRRKAVRLEIQDHHRLRIDTEDPPGAGAR